MIHALSIVIPTKNRHVQCIETVKAIVRYADPFDLVVFDSSDDIALEGMLEELADTRVRHVRAPGTRLNMTQCFEAAIQQARGGYVCMIGDDDGITPALFDWVARAQVAGYTSVTSHQDTYILYNWPDIRSKYFGDSAAGKLFIHLADVPEVDVRNISHAVTRFLDSAGQGCAALPRVYHGLVRRDLLEEIRSTRGQCFDGVSPDVSFSYIAALHSSCHAVIREPLTISGASAVSNAGRSAMRVHKGDLWSDPHMKNFAGEPWPAQVPEFFSVETVWAQATLAAVSRAGGGDYRRYNLHRLYSLLLLRHPDQFRQIVRAMQSARSTDSPMRLRWHAFAGQLLSASIAHVFSGGRKVMRKVFSIPGAKTLSAASIVDASNLVQSELRGAR